MNKALAIIGIVLCLALFQWAWRQHITDPAERLAVSTVLIGAQVIWFRRRRAALKVAS